MSDSDLYGDDIRLWSKRGVPCFGPEPIRGFRLERGRALTDLAAQTAQAEADAQVTAARGSWRVQGAV